MKGSREEPFLFIVDYKIENCEVLSPAEAYISNIFFNFNGIKNYFYEQVSTLSVHIDKYPPSLPTYSKAFDYVKKQIARGNSYLVNLTFPSFIVTQATLSDIFYSARAKYRLYYKDRFVVYSPETFVKIKDRIISTYPMKGTIDASVEGACEKLIQNEKEKAEHATIVDLLRNDLSKRASRVNVNSYRYIDEIKSLDKKLLQVSSEIEGILPRDYLSTLGDIIFDMLPAGSVTGAPKVKTLDIIKNAENYDRGFYTGVAGFFDGKELDSCVLIRYVEKNNGDLIYKSGGGITSQSILEEEYQELIDKIYVPVS